MVLTAKKRPTIESSTADWSIGSIILYLTSNLTGGSGWGSNPPRPATRPATGFEDREAHRDFTTPEIKDTLIYTACQILRRWLAGWARSGLRFRTASAR